MKLHFWHVDELYSNVNFKVLQNVILILKTLIFAFEDNMRLLKFYKIKITFCKF